MFCLMQMYIISSVSMRMYLYDICVCVCVYSFLLFLLLYPLSRRARERDRYREPEMWKYFSINIYVALYAWIVNVQARVGNAYNGLLPHAEYIEYLWAWPRVDNTYVYAARQLLRFAPQLLNSLWVCSGFKGRRKVGKENCLVAKGYQ